jgi:hypothetical protein
MSAKRPSGSSTELKSLPKLMMAAQREAHRMKMKEEQDIEGND